MDLIKTYFKGMLMGVADVIPGISGGTLALITGIYERLIDALKKLSPKSILQILKALLFISHKEQRHKTLKEADLYFLLTLGAGVISAIALATNVIPNLIINHTAVTFSTFLGLILPTLLLPWRLVKKHNYKTYSAFIFGLAITIISTMAVKNQGVQESQVLTFSTATWVCFGSAFIAISAMILPGISGSFILMLLGQYLFILGLVSQFLNNFRSEVDPSKLESIALVSHFTLQETIILLSLFALGCLCGLAIMSRLISKAFERFHDVSMAFLTGMIASAVYVLWPFKQDKLDAFGQILPNKGKWISKAFNIAPDYSSREFKLCLFMFVTSLIISILLLRLGKTDSKDG